MSAHRLLSTTVGRKALIAVSGFVLVLFVFAHLAGNLLVYGGPTAVNAYAEVLHARPWLVWSVRAVLVAALAVHVAGTLALAYRNRRARAGYVRRSRRASTLAGRTMAWSGWLLAMFVAAHVSRLTLGAGHPGFSRGDVYRNVVGEFRSPAVVTVYLAALALLALHLRHGLLSMRASLGLTRTLAERHRNRFVLATVVAVAAGFGSIPLGVLLGILA